MQTAVAAHIETVLSKLSIDPTVNGSDFLNAEEDDGGFWTVIDSADHGGIAMVVTRMNGDSADYAPGVALAHRITQLPVVTAALRAILDAENLLDACTSAKQALAALQIA
ncbi:hypothetical protein [Burkholderia gladioli]|uniref:hypothetical protein n=1 Tax=Burkholderia gladioli TaxID=28095 RepID=UPI001640701B|nr:hypothetical protein [Burkholderia gladioli]